MSSRQGWLGKGWGVQLWETHIEPRAQGGWQAVLHGNGQTIALTDAAGATLDQGCEAADLESRADGTHACRGEGARWSFKAHGDPQSLKRVGDGLVTLSSDDRQRAQQVRRSDGLHLDFTWHATRGVLSQVTWNAGLGTSAAPGSVKLEHAARAAQVFSQDHSGQAYRYSYDERGHLVQVHYLDDSTMDLTYDSKDRIVRVVSSASGLQLNIEPGPNMRRATLLRPAAQPLRPRAAMTQSQAAEALVQEVLELWRQLKSTAEQADGFIVMDTP